MRGGARHPLVLGVCGGRAFYYLRSFLGPLGLGLGRVGLWALVGLFVPRLAHLYLESISNVFESCQCMCLEGSLT